MRFLVDLGNARLKLARLGETGAIEERAVMATDGPGSWRNVIADLGGLASDSEWGIASVRPDAAALLDRLLIEERVSRVQWYRSAADTPVLHRLANPSMTGADRALAVLGGRAAGLGLEGGVVVMCGTAITVERIEPGGLWTGGAIAPGWRPLAHALHSLAAQLPEIEPSRNRPGFGHGDETRSALEAGLRGMVVGGCREILGRVRAGLPVGAITVWTGGDASWLAREVEGERARVEPDLVLSGLASALGWIA
jgi:type III pantothenate kinase